MSCGAQVPESYRASALKYFDEQVQNGTSASAAALRATAGGGPATVPPQEGRPGLCFGTFSAMGARRCGHGRA